MPPTIFLPWQRLSRAVLRPPCGDLTTAAAAEKWGYERPRVLRDALAQHAGFAQVLRDSGVAVEVLGAAPDSLVDACYTCDPALMGPRGLIVLRMGKPQREGEAALLEADARALGIAIVGRIVEPGCVEGGDCLWLDSNTLAVGEGYRSNPSGILQLRFLLPNAKVLAIPMPHHKGPDACLHLQSIISFVTATQAVVYMPLAPVRLIKALQERDIEILPLPEDDYSSLGCNILCLAPGKVVMAAGNDATVALLESHGVEVIAVSADDLMRIGSGGPTCLTLPIARLAD